MTASPPHLYPGSETAPKWLEEAFYETSVPKKNTALRKAYDEIVRLRSVVQGSGDCGEIARLRKGIQDYLDGNYENARKHRGEDPHYRCEHGQHYWEDCSQCVDAHFSRLLGETYTLSSTDGATP